MRWWVMHNTMRKVCASLGVNYPDEPSVGSVAARVLSPEIQMTYMVRGRPEPWEQFAKADPDTYLLGRYDVVCTRAEAEFDRTSSLKMARQMMDGDGTPEQEW